MVRSPSLLPVVLAQRTDELRRTLFGHVLATSETSCFSWSGVKLNRGPLTNELSSETTNLIPYQYLCNPSTKVPGSF